MSWWSRIVNVFRPERLSSTLDAELQFHVAERIDELIAGGMSEKAARAEALRRFGNYTIQKERTRDINMSAWIDTVVGDIKQAARQLRLSPAFASVAILSLALGVGANTAIFQLINALRLKSLPVHDAARLAAVDMGEDFNVHGSYSARNSAFTYAQFQEMKKHQQAFEGMLAFGTTRFNLAQNGEVRSAEGLFATSNFLELLGVRPTLGRGFNPDDDEPGCSKPGAVLDYAFWMREYGGDPSAIGRQIYLRNRTFPIVGVTPPEFFGLEPGYRFDVALPLCADALMSKDGKGRAAVRQWWWLTPVGRLKPNWTVEKASAHFHEISPIIFRETVSPTYRPDALKVHLKNRLKVVSAASGVSELQRSYDEPLYMLLAVTALVLLIACANLANLLLARASARQRELAIRQAIGASRSRLIGQLISESLLLAAIGAAAGALLAQALSRSLVAFLTSADQPVQIQLGIDWNVFLFTSLLALLTCLLFGLAPAIRATAAPPATAMQGGRSSTDAAERHGLRRLLVVSQIALSLVLLVGALLFGRSLRNLITTDTGMVPEGVLVASLDVSLPNLEPERRRAVFEEMQNKITAQIGVVAAAPVLYSPLSGSGWNEGVQPEGANVASAGKDSWMNRVGPGYFHTMKTPLLAGRDFNQNDVKGAPEVCIVNEKFAQTFFNGANPVGRTFRVEGALGTPDRRYQVVGLVKNTKYGSVQEETRSIAFFPVAQDKEAPERLSFMVRSSGPLSSTMAAIRGIVSQMQGRLLVQFRVLDLQIAQTVMRERLMARLSGGFGFLATLLSTLGLYGVITYMVASRRKELGVRIALGAGAADVLRLVFNEAGRLVVVGIAIGLLASWGVTRYAESLLYGLKANDALSITLACILLAVTAMIAALIPARRAARIDPAIVLRSE